MKKSKGPDSSGVSPCHALFERLRNEGHEVVLLESGDGGEGARGWSFVCVVNKKVRVPEGEEGLIFMREFIANNRTQTSVEKSLASSEGPHLKKGKFTALFPPGGEFLPVKSTKNVVPFTAGFVGFVSYDLGEEWTGVARTSHGTRSRAGEIPLAYFVYTDEVYAFRTQSRSAGLNKKDTVTKVLERLATTDMPNPHATLSRDTYFKKLSAIREHLFSGDTYQVNFSQRFAAPFSGDAFDLYKKITTINPSPFQFFMETPRFAVISNSPEKLFSLSAQGVIETQPIKGTVPRGATVQEDARAVAALLKSGKERSELAMIVDLERNDLGKICVPGTVKVVAKRTVQKYSHVIHTLATIRGKLEKKYDWYDALRALFPGGSVTGCPKKRSMEIIQALEDEPRGVYCGSAGYIDLSGACDFNIMIRTLWFEKNKKSGTLTFRSGGGIVVESDPVREYEETLHKAGAILKALL